MLTGLNHLTLAVAELQRSFEFYVDLLEFKPRARWERGAYLSVGDLWLCLTLDPRRGETTGSRDYTHFAFSIGAEEFPAFVSRLRSHAVPEWRENRSEGDSVYFLDPDGHQVEAHVGSLETRLAACRLKPYSGMQFFPD